MAALRRTGFASSPRLGRGWSAREQAFVGASLAGVGRLLEGGALSRFNHPRIASVYHFDSENGTDFIVMEYVPGIALSQRLSEGPLSVDPLRSEARFQSLVREIGLSP